MTKCSDGDSESEDLFLTFSSGDEKGDIDHLTGQCSSSHGMGRRTERNEGRLGMGEVGAPSAAPVPAVPTNLVPSRGCGQKTRERGKPEKKSRGGFRFCTVCTEKVPSSEAWRYALRRAVHGVCAH